ncbi:hypothetical protein EJB05_39270, partial [Eragrostis curvula]
MAPRTPLSPNATPFTPATASSSIATDELGPSIPSLGEIRAAVQEEEDDCSSTSTHPPCFLELARSFRDVLGDEFARPSPASPSVAPVASSVAPGGGAAKQVLRSEIRRPTPPPPPPRPAAAAPARSRPAPPKAAACRQEKKETSFRPSAAHRPPAPRQPPRGPDADGWQTVMRKRSWRRIDLTPSPPPPDHGSPPVPVDLVGKCFNCFLPNHVKADCPNPNRPRCFTYKREGHQAKDCPEPRSSAAGPGTGSRRTSLPQHRQQQDMTAVPIGRRSATEPSRHRQQAHGSGHHPPPARTAWVQKSSLRAPLPEAASSNGGSSQTGSHRGSPTPSPPPSPRSSPSSPAGGSDWGRPNVEIAVIPRSVAIAENERILKDALLAVVRGTRPHVSVRQATLHLEEDYQVPSDKFSVHQKGPGEFLILFKEKALCDRVLHASHPSGSLFRLCFRRWCRQAMAIAAATPYKVIIELENLPLHCWNAEVAQSVVGLSCEIIAFAPSTVTRTDLSGFRILANCVHPSLVPFEKILVIPEPLDGNSIMDGKSLNYRVIVHLLEVQEVTAAPPPPPGGPPDDSMNDGHGDGPSEDRRRPDPAKRRRYECTAGRIDGSWPSLPNQSTGCASVHAQAGTIKHLPVDSFVSSAPEINPWRLFCSPTPMQVQPTPCLAELACGTRSPTEQTGSECSDVQELVHAPFHPMASTPESPPVEGRPQSVEHALSAASTPGLVMHLQMGESSRTPSGEVAMWRSPYRFPSRSPAEDPMVEEFTSAEQLLEAAKMLVMWAVQAAPTHSGSPSPSLDGPSATTGVPSWARSDVREVGGASTNSTELRHSTDATLESHPGQAANTVQIQQAWTRLTESLSPVIEFSSAKSCQVLPGCSSPSLEPVRFDMGIDLLAPTDVALSSPPLGDQANVTFTRGAPPATTEAAQLFDVLVHELPGTSRGTPTSPLSANVVRCFISKVATKLPSSILQTTPRPHQALRRPPPLAIELPRRSGRLEAKRRARTSAAVTAQNGLMRQLHITHAQEAPPTADDLARYNELIDNGLSDDQVLAIDTLFAQNPSVALEREEEV